MSFFKSLFGSLFHDPSSEFDVPGVEHGGRSIGSWFRALANPSAATRAQAEEALAAIGEPALPALEAACSGGDLNARASAAMALGRIGEPALETLVDLMHGEDTRVCVPLALTRMGPSSLSHFVPLFDEGDEAAREGIAYTLAELARATPLAARPRPVPIVTSGDPLQPAGAGRVVADHSEEEEQKKEEEPNWDFSDFVARLTGSLTSDRVSLRREAARALWQIGRKGSASSAEALVAALEDEDPETRLFAAGALAELDAHTDKALEAIIAALDETDDVERARLAVHIIPSFRPETAAPLAEHLVDCLLHADPAVRYHAKIALSHMGKVALPAIVAAAKSPDADLRRRLASVLGDMREHYAAFAEALDDPAPKAPELKARMEGIRSELPRIIRCLIGLANDKDPSVTERALRALGFGSLSRIPEEARKEYADTLAKLDRIAYQDLIAAALRGTPVERKAWGLPLFGQLEENEREELVYELLRDMVRTPEVQEKGLEVLKDLNLDKFTLDSLLGDVHVWATEEAPIFENNWRELEKRIR